ncbi:hypothetical protein ACQ1Q1_05770 [Ornithobacterium rhinotracheale]|uniref:hypothetical protein n=2 Tax=Ornithobacterium rhinotracheale TaxID=28251 RepID=UPI0039FC8086
MKEIKNLKELEVGKFYKGESNDYYKFSGFNGIAGAEAISFSLSDYGKGMEDYISLETPWLEIIFKECGGLVEISEEEFLKAFKKFCKHRKEILKLEKNTLKIAELSLL